MPTDFKKKWNTHDHSVCSGAFPASSQPVTHHKNIHIKAFRVLNNNLTPRLCSSHSLSATSSKNHSMIYQKHFQQLRAFSWSHSFQMWALGILVLDVSLCTGPPLLKNMCRLRPHCMGTYPSPARGDSNHTDSTPVEKYCMASHNLSVYAVIHQVGFQLKWQWKAAPVQPFVKMKGNQEDVFNRSGVRNGYLRKVFKLHCQ